MTGAAMTNDPRPPGNSADCRGDLPIPGLFNGFAAIDVDTKRVRFAGVTLANRLIAGRNGGVGPARYFARSVVGQTIARTAEFWPSGYVCHGIPMMFVNLPYIKQRLSERGSDYLCPPREFLVSGDSRRAVCPSTHPKINLSENSSPTELADQISL